MPRSDGAYSTTTVATATADPRRLSAFLPMRQRWRMRLDTAFQDTTDGDNLAAAIVLEASPTEVKAVLSDGEEIAITGDGLKFAARALGRQGARDDPHSPRRDDPRRARRQGPLADHPDAAGRSRIRVGPTHRRDDLFAGGRLRLRPQQVQSRHAGLSPARIELQAVHLFGRARKGLQPGDRGQRRAALFRCGADRRATRGSRRTTTANSKVRCACAPR